MGRYLSREDSLLGDTIMKIHRSTRKGGSGRRWGGM